MPKSDKKDQEGVESRGDRGRARQPSGGARRGPERAARDAPRLAAHPGECRSCMAAGLRRRGLQVRPVQARRRPRGVRASPERREI